MIYPLPPTPFLVRHRNANLEEFATVLQQPSIIESTDGQAEVHFVLMRPQTRSRRKTVRRMATTQETEDAAAGPSAWVAALFSGLGACSDEGWCRREEYCRRATQQPKPARGHMPAFALSSSPQSHPALEAEPPVSRQDPASLSQLSVNSRKAAIESSKAAAEKRARVQTPELCRLCARPCLVAFKLFVAPTTLLLHAQESRQTTKVEPSC